MNTYNEQATYQLRQTVLGTSWDISPCGNRLEFAVAIHCKVMILFGGSAPQTGPNWAINSIETRSQSAQQHASSVVMACPILDKIKLEFYDESSRWIFASHVTCITHSLTPSLTHSLDLIECHSIKNMVFPKIPRPLRINRKDSFEAWLGIHPNLNRGTIISLRGQELAEPSQAQPSPPKKPNPEVAVAVRMSGKLWKTRPEKGLHGEHLYKDI